MTDASPLSVKFEKKKQGTGYLYWIVLWRISRVKKLFWLRVEKTRIFVMIPFDCRLEKNSFFFQPVISCRITHLFFLLKEFREFFRKYNQKTIKEYTKYLLLVYFYQNELFLSGEFQNEKKNASFIIEIFLNFNTEI